jgi:hypothetical protein
VFAGSASGSEGLAPRCKSQNWALTDTIEPGWVPGGARFVGLADIAHKTFSPGTYQCQLCQLTPHRLHVKSDWSAFIRKLEQPSRFLHRDEFRREFPDQAQIPLPAIFVQSDNKLPQLIDQTAIGRCDSMASLIQLIQNRMATVS